MAKHKFKNLIPIVIFCIVLMGPIISWGVLSILNINNPSIMEVLDFDLGEKRKKATFSNVLRVDNITSELERYYNDRIPYRSILITNKNSIDTFLEQPYKGVEEVLMFVFSGGKFRKSRVLAETIDGRVKLYMDDAVDIFTNHGLKKEEIDPYAENINYPIKYMNEKVIIGQSNWLFLNFNNQIYYRGENQLKPNEYANYIKPYEAINDLLESLGKKLVIIVCPEKEEIYNEYMPTVEIKDPIERPQRIRDYIATASNVKYIYPKEEILKYKSKYRLYLKYDSHWSDTGGYIAANEIKKALGEEIIPLRDCAVIKEPEKTKDLVFLGGGDKNAYPDGFQYAINYKPDVMNEYVYSDESVMLNVLQYSSNATNKKQCVILGDSYRTPIFNVFCKDYSLVTSCAFNYMGNPVVDRALKNADLIIFEAVERNEEQTLALMCQKIYQLLGPK